MKAEVQRLRSIQRVLSREIEEVFRDYDQQLQHVTAQLQAAGTIEDPVALSHALGDIQEQQARLWRMLFRFQATGKTQQTLLRELAEWEERADGELRAEMLRSELATREIATRETEKEESSEQVLREAVLDFPLPASSAVSQEVSPAAVSDQDIIVAIREATREAERWHALSHSAHDHEAIIQVRHVRELHGALKAFDREHGIRRERLPFAIRIRDTV
jgi:hypothetical protein